LATYRRAGGGRGAALAAPAVSSYNRISWTEEARDLEMFINVVIRFYALRKRQVRKKAKIITLRVILQFLFFTE
jgi:hypothetical protein